MNKKQEFEYLSKAVSILRTLGALDDLAIYRELIAEGVEHKFAARVVEFLPIAYGRLLMAKSGSRFSDSFQRRLPNGSLSEPKAFSSEPVWDTILSFAQNEIERGLSKEDFLCLAARSAEFQAANEFLHKGHRLDDLDFTSPLLPWAAEGPEGT